jgi:methionyl-tRNA formyltransferase
MIKVHIASSRWAEIGNRCFQYAQENLPTGSVLTLNPDECDVFISVLYGNLVSEEFISKRRCYNFHPGILPQYRGAGAFSWAIINGEDYTGITLHELDVDIDTGPIIDSARFPIMSSDTAETLFNEGMDRLFDMFRSWFVILLVIGPDRNTPIPQDNSKACTYYRKDLKAQQDLTRFVRAFTFEGKEPAFYTDRNGNKVELRW